MRKRFGTLRRGSPAERGQALVEFSLVIVVFLLFVFGILDMARLFQSWTDVQHAAREGARFGVTGLSKCTIDKQSYDTRELCIKHTVWDATTGMLGGGEGATDATMPVAIIAGQPCEAMEVKVTYNHKFITPLLQVAAPSGIRLVGSQRMINEPDGVCQ